MRPVLPGDLVAAGRALLAAPPGERAGLARRLLRDADAADRFRKRLGRAHPEWGNGTLMAAALARPVAPEPRLDAPDYLRCQIEMLSALLERRRTGR